MNAVTVGRYTYGNLDVKSWGNSSEKLVIGSYCSIADDVMFILGGNHEYKYFSTFPVRRKLLQEESETTTKGPIIVADDVWIGMGVKILSGVHIGQGAVIGAGSVVTKNVDPYTIVAGNPAKVIKQRFDRSIVEKLIKIDFSNITVDFFKKNPDLLNSYLDMDVLMNIKGKIG